MMLSVNALTRLLNANATTKPTATTMTSPRIKKFLKPFSIRNSSVVLAENKIAAAMAIAVANATMQQSGTVFIENCDHFSPQGRGAHGPSNGNTQMPASRQAYDNAWHLGTPGST